MPYAVINKNCGTADVNTEVCWPCKTCHAAVFPRPITSSGH